MRETIKTKAGRTITVPTPEEDAAINRGIAADPDNPEWGAEDFAHARRFPELVAERKRMGRPLKENRKELVSVRYDADILAEFRAMGEGWQTRMNDALREWLKEHRPA